MFHANKDIYLHTNHDHLDIGSHWMTGVHVVDRYTSNTMPTKECDVF